MAFQASDPKIYRQQQIKGLNRQWHEEDMFMKLAPLMSKGFSWDVADGRLKRMGPTTMQPQSPWCHGKGTYKKNCLFDHHIVFDLFDIIPKACIDCWKVVVTPKTVHQLMEMEAIQQQLPWPCKCGIEMRDYTPKFYGAYFYNHSFDEGRSRYEEVVKLVKDNMPGGKDLVKDIILKRGCTEFEMLKGPSPFWHMTAKEEEMYEILRAYVVQDRSHMRQPESIKNHVRQVWLLWAHSINDMTYLQYNDNTPLFPGYVKYHEGNIDGIKADLAIAKAEKVAGLTPETTLKFLETAQLFADRHNVESLESFKAALDIKRFDIVPDKEEEVPSEETPTVKLADVDDDMKGEEDGTF